MIRKYIDHDFNILDECTFGNRANFLQDAQIREEEINVQCSKNEKIMQDIYRAQSRTSNHKAWFRYPVSLVRKFWEM